MAFNAGDVRDSTYDESSGDCGARGPGEGARHVLALQVGAALRDDRRPRHHPLTSRTPLTVLTFVRRARRHVSRPSRRGSTPSAASPSSPTPRIPRRRAVPVRQILWEFAGDIEVILANLREEKGRYRHSQLLPLPFDARLLKK